VILESACALDRRLEWRLSMPVSPETLIANSSIAAVVSDPGQQDNPIVACNEAFCKLTGYRREEIIGRGSGTEPEATAELREAVRQGRAALVELTNYRRDGTPFRNAVMIAPIFDEAGRLAYFLGSQMAVGDSGNEARERALALIEGLTRRQREVLEALARGRLNKQMAYELSLTERTVKMHRAALLRALGVKTAAEAIRIAIEAGL
jgi:PAS domain S-box-containing protein